MLLQRESLQSLTSLSETELLEKQIAEYNAEQGHLKYFDCPKCKNKGYIAIAEEGTMAMQFCTCKEARKSARLLEVSGINEDYTLENYKAKFQWQQNILRSAEKFAENPRGWFYMGGQVGSGKSHICTGIVRKLIAKGNGARYMKWRDDSTVIKASIKYADDYAGLVDPLKEAPVLYIDDFLKTNSGEPTTADINLAFEIINARYNRKDLVTIISSEYYIGDLLEVDQAVGSRVFERSRNYCHNIAKDKAKNYRLVNDGGRE